MMFGRKRGGWGGGGGGGGGWESTRFDNFNPVIRTPEGVTQPRGRKKLHVQVARECHTLATLGRA